MTRSIHALAALSLLLLGGCSGSDGGGPVDPPPPAASCTFLNPVADGADPWVVKRDSVYYLVQARGNGIFVSRSTKLTEVTRSAVQVWAAPDTGWNRTNVWAPELHFIDGRWYIYYAAGRAGPPFVHQRSGVLQSAGDDPQGAYVDRGMLDTGDEITTLAENKWAIDLNVGRINGQTYAVWSGWERDAATDRTPQHLYIARMSNPWTIGSARVRISSPTESWERGTELDLQEGPTFLQRGGQTFIVYSTRESWLRDYRLGQLRLASPDADPLSPASWTKTGPVFAGTDDVFGAGHASFTVSPDNTESWIVYHSKTGVAPGWERVIRMQKFTWNADGSPSFGTPTPRGQAVASPSGECRTG
jgi:GH43 family beta-xylosidase